MPPRSIRFSDWLWEAIDREARANGMSKAEFTRMVLASGVTLSAARRGAGFVGPAADLLEAARVVLAAQDDED